MSTVTEVRSGRILSPETSRLGDRGKEVYYTDTFGGFSLAQHFFPLIGRFSSTRLIVANE